MIKRAIVATDLSEASNVMVKNLGFLSDFGIKELLLLQCPDYQEVASEIYPFVAHVQTDTIKDQQAKLEALGFIVESRISPGNAQKEITRIAEEESFPLVIVGSRGRSLIGGAFLGGVAHEVMLRTTKPLLIVRLSVDENKELAVAGISEEGVASHILYATDFSKGSEHAFHYLQEIVDLEHVKKVTLFHVQDKSRIEPHLVDRLDEFNKTDKDRLHELAQRLEGSPSVEIETKLVYGTPATEIIKELEVSGATFLIMAKQGRGFFKELFVGSVSHYVSRRAQIPILMIPVTSEEA